MRSLPLALAPFALLAGCAGNVADYVGSRPGIVAPQLTRFGLNLRETNCVSEKLGTSLTPLQLRRLVRSASAVRQGISDPDRLTFRDLSQVAAGDARVAAALAQAAQACGVGAPVAVAPEVVVAAIPPVATAQAATWLNLGAAGSGQSIAVNAATIERQGTSRQAWFRLTNPGATVPDDNHYLLQVDCSARTINAKARRKQDAAGAITESREYSDAAGPVEGGTVMEIAYLALCT